MLASGVNAATEIALYFRLKTAMWSGDGGRETLSALARFGSALSRMNDESHYSSATEVLK